MKECPTLQRGFIGIDLNQIDDNARIQYLKCSRERQFAVSFYALELRREHKEHKEDFVKVGESKVGIALQDN